MQYVEQLFSNIDSIPTAVIVVLIIALAFKFMWELGAWFIEKLGLETKFSRQKKSNDEVISTLQGEISELKNNFGTVTEWMTKDEKNTEVLEKLCDSMNALQTDIKDLNLRFNSMESSVKSLEDKVHKMEEDNKKRKLVELKDRIAQSYRYFHERGEWKKMDKESMNDLINMYNSLGGNSFVHETVIPESLTWKVIDE